MEAQATPRLPCRALCVRGYDQRSELLRADVPLIRGYGCVHTVPHGAVASRSRGEVQTTTDTDSSPRVLGLFVVAAGSSGGFNRVLVVSGGGGGDGVVSSGRSRME